MSQALNRLEKGKEKGIFTLASFIDISSAFDELDPYKATRALIKRGVDTEIAFWYRDYLTERHAYVNIKGRKSLEKT